MDNQNLITTDLQIDSFGHAQLLQTSKWAKFLSILGFITSALLVLLALAFPTYIASGEIGVETAGIGAMISLMYVIAALINFVVSLFLFKYAVAMQKALATTSQDQLNLAFKNHKMVYKIIGVLTIIYLCFLAITIIFGAIGTIMS